MQMLSDRHFAVAHDLTSQLYSNSVAPFKNTTYRYELKYKGGRSMTDFYDLDIGRHCEYRVVMRWAGIV